MRKGLLALISLMILTGCHQQSTPSAMSAPAEPQVTNTADHARDVNFERKVACFDATGAFVYDAISPRDGKFAMTRNCYVPSLDTCVAEYVSPDGSATVFDVLTRETIAIYLNYPGDADQIRVSERLSGFTAAGPADPPGEDMTKERREYVRLSTHLFASCAE